MEVRYGEKENVPNSSSLHMRGDLAPCPMSQPSRVKTFCLSVIQPPKLQVCVMLPKKKLIEKTQSKNIHVSISKLTYFHVSIGNFCHRKWELPPNWVAVVVVHDMGLCFVWDGPSILWRSISVTGLQSLLGPGSLQLDLFYHGQGNLLLFTLRWMSWSHLWTKQSQDFQSLNISPCKYTHTFLLVSMQNWRDSPKQTPGICFSCSKDSGEWDLIASKGWEKACEGIEGEWWQMAEES